MARWPGLGERIKERLLGLGFVVGDKPDIMRFCDERRYRHGYFFKWANYGVTPEPENLERLAVDLGVTPEWLLFGPVIFDRNRPLAVSPARRSGRGRRPTLGANGARLPEPVPEISNGVPTPPRTLPVGKVSRKRLHNKAEMFLWGPDDALPRAA